MNEKVVEILINNGVKNLKEYGYPNVKNENILTDKVYSAFFLEMLKRNLGEGYDTEINYLINVIEESEK